MCHLHPGALLPPSLDSKVEDGDVEREEEEDADDGQAGDAGSSDCGVEALI